jgi:asparagine synthase (glutamine-hydrolysing)
MIFAEIKLSPQPGTSELRLDGLDDLHPPRSRLLSLARDEVTGTVVVFAGRLHYRQDLRRRLNLALEDATATAADWVLAAYRAGTVAALNDLEGEYSLLIHDPRTRLLHLQRSVMGDIPLYWCLAGGAVLAGTSLHSLAAQAEPWAVNHDHLASFLLDPHTAAGFGTEATALHPVCQVVPGMRITLDTSGQVRRTRFWDWTRHLRDQTRLSRPEAARRYLELLDVAILERSNGDLTAAEHSGGFDSSTVVCRARDHLARGVGRGPLLTVSLDYPFPEMAGEGAFMRQVTDQGGPMEAVYLREDAALDFDGFPEQVPVHDEPSAYLFRCAIDRQLIDVAAGWGARTLLTGGGAELLVEPNLEYLTDLARAGQWRAAFREARRWAADQQTTLGLLARDYFVTPLLPACLRQGWGVWRRGGYAQWPQLTRDTIAPWITPGFARQARLRDRAIEHLRQRSRGRVAWAHKIHDLQATASNWAGWHLAIQGKGIVLSHPFQDPRLLAFGLSLPREVRQEPGQIKPLLAEATRGILPEPIRTRRYKCGFDRVNLEGFRAALGRVRSFLSTTDRFNPGIIDRGRLDQALLAHAQGLGNAVVGGHITAALSLLVWLKQLAEHPPAAGRFTQTVALAS